MGRENPGRGGMAGEGVKKFRLWRGGNEGRGGAATGSISVANAPTCRFALRLRRGGASAAAAARDVHFSVGIDALDVIADKCAEARRAIETLAPGATPES